jgi:hypothetical protein
MKDEIKELEFLMRLKRNMIGRENKETGRYIQSLTLPSLCFQRQWVSE